MDPPEQMSIKFQDSQHDMTGQPTIQKKATVIGIYGLPGCGKSYLLGQLGQDLSEEQFDLYEGSGMIDSLVPGGLEAFKKLKEEDKLPWRELAINTIGINCAESGRAAVVAGHLMFWSKEEDEPKPAYTPNDLRIYTHIIYLDVPIDVIAQRCLEDTERNRPILSIDHLRRWQEMEKNQLRHLCREHGILFYCLSTQSELLDKVSNLLQDFKDHTEEWNLACVERRIDKIVSKGKVELETMLVLDADRTLTAKDSGKIFWDMINTLRQHEQKEDQLKALFSSSLGYTYTAFRQATLLYEEAVNDRDFEALCDEVVSTIPVYPEFLSLLRELSKCTHEHVGAIIVTCGLRRVWQKILEREGLANWVEVIGGGRISDQFVVTAAVKAAVVARLRAHHIYVWAFGDSVLDLPMLGRACQAIVVVGEEQTRSKTMEPALLDAIDNGGLVARQVLLPASVTPRLDTTKLPLMSLTDPDFISSITRRRSRNERDPLQVFHCTDKNLAKLLMTPMRDASISGPALREAHRRVGWYLALEYLTDIIGFEEYQIPHVQGHNTAGYRLRHEKTTLIIALMRGGEPMAFGVSDAFPCAMFLHAKSPEDIKKHNLSELHTVVLVDSVINSGKTVVEFFEHIRGLHRSIRIVVIAGVIQAKAVSNGKMAQQLSGEKDLSFVALRLSENQFTGKGTTDTGNRLFNTTHIP